MAPSTLLSALMAVGVANANTIKCPDSEGDSVYWSTPDIGLSIFSSSSSRGADCFLRHSSLYPASSISTEWIDPSRPTLVFSHGWASGVGNDHGPDDQWSDIESFTGDGCVGDANYGNVEPCEPTDYDTRLWTANGWNVIYLDWRQYADEGEVKDAEKKLYTAVQGSKNVVDLLFDKLIDVLDMTGWIGDELRLAGHSLGAQLVLNLAAKIKTDSDASAYKDKLKRIALLDHFFSNYGKDYLPQSDPGCNDWCFWGACWSCSHLWVSEYQLDYVLKDIRGSGGVVPVIENYRTSLTSSNPFVGDSADDFNKRTVFAELKPWYYPSWALDAKHITAIPAYLHCMKWTGTVVQDGAPSCRMSTEELQAKCTKATTSNWRKKCDKRYVQDGNDAAYTTWDYDDSFQEYNV